MKRCIWERFMPLGPQATLYQSRVFCSSNHPACALHSRTLTIIVLAGGVAGSLCQRSRLSA